MTMFTPREYLSFSQMTLFEMSPEKYLEKYVYLRKEYVSQNMLYGSKIAKGLEDEEATGDPLLDLVMTRLPKFERMDKPVEGGPGAIEVYYERDKKNYRVPVLENSGGNIPLLAVPDTATGLYQAFKEYKTSTRKWTRRMADESGQITFYATTIWLATGISPKDQYIELVNVPVEYNKDGRLQPTNEIVRLPTKRTMADAIRMTRRMRNVWAGINELCKNELL